MKNGTTLGMDSEKSVPRSCLPEWPEVGLATCVRLPVWLRLRRVEQTWSRQPIVLGGYRDWKGASVWITGLFSLCPSSFCDLLPGVPAVVFGEGPARLPASTPIGSMALEA